MVLPSSRVEPEFFVMFDRYSSRLMPLNTGYDDEAENWKLDAAKRDMKEARKRYNILYIILILLRKICLLFLVWTSLTKVRAE